MTEFTPKQAERLQRLLDLPDEQFNAILHHAEVAEEATEFHRAKRHWAFVWAWVERNGKRIIWLIALFGGIYAAWKGISEHIVKLGSGGPKP